jgi:hypothetical protein
MKLIKKIWRSDGRPLTFASENKELKIVMKCTSNIKKGKKQLHALEGV